MTETTSPLSFALKSLPVLTLLSTCLLALAGGYVLGMFAEIAEEQDVALGELPSFILAHRQWFFVIVLPAVLLTVAGFFVRSSMTRMLLNLLAALLLIIAFAAILIAAIGAVAPLYQYQPI